MHTNPCLWNPCPCTQGLKPSHSESQYSVKFYVRSLNINHAIPAGSCPGWQMGRGSSLWRCRTACSNVLVMRICPTPSLHRPFLSPSPLVCFYVLQLLRVSFSSSGNGSRVGLCCPLGPCRAQSRAGGAADGCWSCSGHRFGFEQVMRMGGWEGGAVRLSGAHSSWCCCPVPPWAEEGFVWLSSLYLEELPSPAGVSSGMIPQESLGCSCSGQQHFLPDVLPAALLRYHVHSKLVSFMAPIDQCTMNDDAR